MSLKQLGVGWGFWGRWVAATAIGWVVGLIGAIILSYLVVNVVYPKETSLIVGVCLGAAVGYSQKLAVRCWLVLTSTWVWGALIGVGIPFVVAEALDVLWPGASELPEGRLPGRLLIAVAGGVIAGLLQMRELRQHTDKAGWWVPASVVAWSLARLANETGWLMGPLSGLLAPGMVLGAVSGGFLVWILRSGGAETVNP